MKLNKIITVAGLVVLVALGTSCQSKKAKEAAERAAAEAAAAACDQPLNPVTLGMILPMLPDNVLANELRRRGYTLCAFRPALVEL